MMTHYILLSSSYSKGKRIALDFIVEEEIDFEKKMNHILQEIKEKCGEDVSFSSHYIQTNSKEWKSVVEKDFFFKDVVVIKSVNNFISLIKKDRKLDGLDVAKYLLTKIRCTHLKLEKLTYYCYADYLCKYHKKLFYDDIFAFQYGPVISSVYDKLKKKGYEEIDEKDIETEGIYEMPARSRILFAEDGLDKIRSIDETLLKYSKKSANELVTMTHRENTPWSLSGKGRIIKNRITDDKIIQYHKNEL